MGKHTTALVKKSIEMAMLEMKIAVELLGEEDRKVSDPIEHLESAETLIARAKELLA